MKREPRGFRYALEPLRLKCDWELQEQQIKLAELNRKIAELEYEVAHYESMVADASADLLLQQGKARIIYADKQQLAQAYIAHQAQLAARARKACAELAAEREKCTRDLHRLRKFADGLDENRMDDIKEFAVTIDRAESAETDDAWLRGKTWRSKQ
jgi:hypothetical protein